jgi:hypothetical protein
VNAGPASLWTITELVERKRLPRGRLREAVRAGRLPVVACAVGDLARANDDQVLVDLPALNRWLGEERGPGVDSWVDEWYDRRGTVHGPGTRRSQPKKEGR